ncbi:MAG: hypothetical protein Q9199_007061 [Rusavskia elegans]
MAPEYRDLLTNSESSDFTTAVDMWSFGCLIYELFKRKCPFDEGDALMSYMRNGAFPRRPLDDCSASSDSIQLILMLLDRDPYRRWKGLEHLPISVNKIDDHVQLSQLRDVPPTVHNFQKTSVLEGPKDYIRGFEEDKQRFTKRNPCLAQRLSVATSSQEPYYPQHHPQHLDTEIHSHKDEELDQISEESAYVTVNDLSRTTSHHDLPEGATYKNVALQPALSTPAARDVGALENQETWNQTSLMSSLSKAQMEMYETASPEMKPSMQRGMELAQLMKQLERQRAELEAALRTESSRPAQEKKAYSSYTTPTSGAWAADKVSSVRKTSSPSPLPPRSKSSTTTSPEIEHATEGLIQRLHELATWQIDGRGK